MIKDNWETSVYDTRIWQGNSYLTENSRIVENFLNTTIISAWMRLDEGTPKDTKKCYSTHIASSELFVNISLKHSNLAYD